MCAFLITSLIKPIRVSYKWEVNLGNEINCRLRRGRSCGNNAGESRQLAKKHTVQISRWHISTSDRWECFFESLNIGRLECFVVEKTEVQKCSSREFGNFKISEYQTFAHVKRWSWNHGTGGMEWWLCLTLTDGSILLQQSLSSSSRPSPLSPIAWWSIIFFTSPRCEHAQVTATRHPSLSRRWGAQICPFVLFWNLTLKEQPVPRSPGLKHRKALVHFSALIQLPVSRLSPPTSHTLLMLQLVSHYAASESLHCWSLKTSRSRFLAVWLGFVLGESSRPHVAGILISCFCHQNWTLRP